MLQVNVNDKAIQVISKAIRDTVAQQLATAPFDITLQGIVKDKLVNNFYNIEIQGNTYKIKSNLELNINQFVNVLVPQNNYTNMTILSNGSDSGGSEPTDSVISVNGKTGAVILEIEDIPNLLTTLNSKLIVDNIVAGQHISLTKSGNNITINSNDYTYEFTQTNPASTWQITHNLNKYPSVTILDSNKERIYAPVNFTNKNSLSIDFSEPVAGTAIMN